jgi:TetR/AcrR family transcriptional regulator, regulator of autoinduction and epiphytic fitness
MERKRSPEARLDGRKARSQRSREAVIKALLDFVQEGKPRPSATEIARRAKVSRRVVFNQFKDIESLRAIVMSRFGQQENRKFWRPIPPELPLPERLEAFVRARSARLEHVTPFRHASLVLAPLSPQITEGVRAGAARAHAEVKAVFDTEIRQLPTARRGRFTTLLIAVCSWPLWNMLRQDLKLSQPRAREAMMAMVAAVIERELKTEIDIAG